MGDLVDSSETVIEAVALRLLCFTLRPAVVLVKFLIIICCAVIIYCVELNHFAVEIRRIVVHGC